MEVHLDMKNSIGYKLGQSVNKMKNSLHQELELVLIALAVAASVVFVWWAAKNPSSRRQSEAQASVETSVTPAPVEVSASINEAPIAKPEPPPPAPKVVTKEECAQILSDFKSKSVHDKFILASAETDAEFQKCSQFFSELEKKKYTDLQKVDCKTYNAQFLKRKPAPFTAFKELFRKESTSDYRKYRACKDSLTDQNVPFIVNMAGFLLKGAAEKCPECSYDNLIAAAQITWDAMSYQEQLDTMRGAWQLGIPEI